VKSLLTVLPAGDTVAVRHAETTWTGRDLDRAANRIAHWLIARGVGVGDRVGLALPRAPGLVAAVLGVWRAGAALVPLDPDHPPARLEYVLGDADPAVLLVGLDTAARLPLTARPTLVVDDPSGPLRDCSVDPPAVVFDDDELAYVLYTSGTTGTPKGVCVEHKGLANYLDWADGALPSAPRGGAGSVLHSPLTFDFSFTSLFVPLLRGEPLWLLPAGAGLSDLAETLTAESGTGFIRLTPSHLVALLPAVGGRTITSRALLVGGEALAPALLADWMALPGHPRLINHYGPTETVIGRCVFPVPADLAPVTVRGWRTVPIGRPIGNTVVTVVDSAGAPVAAGQTGEILIGGTGIARGYRNQPELTAQRFSVDPAGHRRYHTGDLGRWNEDGQLEFLGRSDLQVKVRGFRVELGEIENRLLAHPRVRQAAAIARPGPDGIAQIVAFVVVDGSVEESDLRDHLAGWLPAPMMPARCVPLPGLPRTANGKTDRAALAELPIPDPADDSVPGTPVETTLAEVWCAVLGLDRIGRGTNFFDVGGNSIAALRIAARARDRGLALRPEAVLEHQTIAALASALVDQITGAS
jgi:amino acid adenylation domain-containing protein